MIYFNLHARPVCAHPRAFPPANSLRACVRDTIGDDITCMLAFVYPLNILPGVDCTRTLQLGFAKHTIS
jgi:hypothetical protein